MKSVAKMLKEMNPVLMKEEYVFCSLPKTELNKLKIEPILIFKEKEGVTIILPKEIADSKHFCYSGVWSLITLTLQTDLTDVGLIAAISKRLAEKGISINIVSAFYHDHIFIPVDKAKEAMNVLIELQKC